MKADSIYLYQLFEGEKQYVVPLFQRRYVWEDKNWEQLWNDVFRLVESTKTDEDFSAEHFLGAIVCLPGEHLPYRVPQYILIDGHQRVATLAILLCALRDVSRELGLSNLADQIQEKYLTDKFKDGIERYKVISKQKDRDMLFKLIDQKLPLTWDVQYSSSIPRAYNYFKEQILQQCPNEKDIQRLYEVITKKLSVVMITLASDDNPSVIFETLNWRGQPLEEADLVRNYVFMHITLEEQEKFDKQIWTPFEEVFAEKSISITDFYRDFLMSDGSYVGKREVYMSFRRKYDIMKIKPEERVKELEGLVEELKNIRNSIA